MRFADDTRLYHGISNVDDCTILQNDLNYVYNYTSCINMSFNAQTFQYIYVLAIILHYLVTYTPVLVFI